MQQALFNSDNVNEKLDMIAKRIDNLETNANNKTTLDIEVNTYVKKLIDEDSKYEKERKEDLEEREKIRAIDKKKREVHFAKWQKTNNKWWTKWGSLYKICLAISIGWAVTSLYVALMYGAMGELSKLTETERNSNNKYLLNLIFSLLFMFGMAIIGVESPYQYEYTSVNLNDESKKSN